MTRIFIKCPNLYNPYYVYNVNETGLQFQPLLF